MTISQATICELLQGAFFYWSALKMTKCQPLKEFSELVLPQKRLRMKKVPELVLLKRRNSSNTLIFLVKTYFGVDTKNFSGGTVSGPVQVLFFIFSNF